MLKGMVRNKDNADAASDLFTQIMPLEQKGPV